MTPRILLLLKRSAGHAMSEAVLLTEARLQYGACGETQLQDCLQRLEREGLALREVDRLTGDVRWSVTAKGRAHE